MGIIKKVEQGSLAPSVKKLLMVCSPESILKLRINTMQKAIESNTKTIGSVIRDTNKKRARSIVMLWLSYVDQQINAPNMTDVMYRTCADMIIDNYSALKFGDLSNVFNKILTGQVKIYGGLDTPKIMSLFSEYYNERLEFAASKSQQKSRDLKQSIDDLGNIKKISL